MAARLLGLLVAAWRLAWPAAGVQVADLQNFFSSPSGLAMPPGDAASLASREAGYLTQCGVTVKDLQALRDALYSPGQLDLPLADVRSNLLPLAYQHAVPADLVAMYQALVSPTGPSLSQQQAQSSAMGLATKHAEPYLLGPLFQVLYYFWDVGLPLAQARQLAIDLTAAGADAGTLQASYLDAVKRMPKDAALQAAIADAVDANLQGLAARYAKDGQLYVAREFQQYFGSTWLAEWQAGVPEKRTAPDGVDYRAAEFLQYFGAAYWASLWQAAPPAVLRRISADGQTYTLDEFQRFYGATAWQAEWAKSYEVLDVCAGLTQTACATQPRCQWQWTGDWTTSCVVRPLGEQKKPAAADLVV